MIIKRELAARLSQDKSSFIQILLGPRQCGKSTLLYYLSSKKFQQISFDDLQMRTLAESDPGLFISQFPPPLIIDEVQYAPNIFPELKLVVDRAKQKTLLSERVPDKNTLFRLTGSDQILLDKKVKESLVGRARYYYLNSLSVAEILKSIPNFNIFELLYRGGYPELYTDMDIPVNEYYNAYIRNYIERDIVLSAGIKKQLEFHTVLGMLAARTGGFLNYTSIAQDSGIKSVTIKEWVSILQRTDLVYLLPPVTSNLNKRLLKTPKLYFMDTGLATRLQGWNQLGPLMKSPQIGPLFENLVLAEIVKYIRNHGKNWTLSVWRTKEGEEIDFIIENETGSTLALDAKLGIHSVKPSHLPKQFRQAYPQTNQLILVSIGGTKIRLNETCLQCPISQLSDVLDAFI